METLMQNMSINVPLVLIWYDVTTGDHSDTFTIKWRRYHSKNRGAFWVMSPMLEIQVKVLKCSWILGNSPALQDFWVLRWQSERLYSLLDGSEGDTAAHTDQDSCHTSQGCVIVQLWTQQVRVWLKGPFMVANLSGDIAFQQNEDQLKTHYRGGRSTGLAMMIFDCSASAATCVKFISIRSGDFSLPYLPKH